MSAPCAICSFWAATKAQCNLHNTPLTVEVLVAEVRRLNDQLKKSRGH